MNQSKEQNCEYIVVGNMKILVVTQYYYPEPLRINDICEELVKRGHIVTVLTTNPNYPNGDIYDGYKNKYNIEIIKGVKVIRCKSRPRYKGNFNLALNYISFCVNASIKSLRLKEEFDVVYAYQLSPITSVIPAIIYKKLHKKPLLLYCLDVWPESLKGSQLEKGIIYNLIKRLSVYIYRSADKILVTSPSFIGYIRELCSVTNVSLLYQHSNEVPLIAVPEDLAHYKKYTNFVFMGNIGKSQNIECVLQAISLIKERKGFRVHIVGSGSFFAQSLKIANQLNVSDVVIFHGRKAKEEMPKYYSIADVCIVSLKDEGFVGYTIPGKLQEYMAAGKAVLGIIKGDAQDIIINSNCGIVVSPNDCYSLSQCINRLIKDRDSLSMFSKNSRKFYLNNFTLKQHIKQLISEMDLIRCTHSNSHKL